MKTSRVFMVIGVLVAAALLGVSATAGADDDWYPTNATESEWIGRTGQVTIGNHFHPASDRKLFIADAAGPEGEQMGMWFSKNVTDHGTFGLGLMINVPNGYFTSIAKAGDFLLIARRDFTDPPGIVINTYHDNDPGGIRIDENGHVGINTPDPGASMLAVDGLVESLTSGFKFPDDTIQTTKAVGDGYSLDAADGSPTDALFVDNNGNVGIGATNTLGNKLYVDGQASVESIEIRGSDLAERFDVRGGRDVVPGLVASIDPENPGALRISEQPYDRTVVGVVSGASGVRTGITMGQAGTLADGDFAVAMTGRVYVKADTSNGPIVPGDLLTTSSTPGHVMKATDHQRAQGAVLGKAMTALDHGTGEVLMVVALQ